MKETLGTYGFAPLRHLRHFLIGRGKGGAVAHHHLSRTRSTTLRRHTAGWRLRLADHALARTPDRQTQRGTDHAKSFKVDSFEKGCIALVIGMRVLRAPIGGISTRQQARGIHANTLVEYQAHNRSWTIARSAARVTQPVFLLARGRVALNPSSHRRPSYGLARRIGSNVGSNRRINTDRSVQNQSLESVVSPICTFGASLRRDLRARSLMTFSTLGGKEARARPGDR
jgi:hypothetical protein